MEDENEMMEINPVTSRSTRINSTTLPRWHQIIETWDKRFQKQKKNWYNIFIYQKLPTPKDYVIFKKKNNDDVYEKQVKELSL
jgi:hypothetical protein